ncbi:MAG: efflux RND transporter permease subunit [Terracidiphilus sp.]
MAHQKSEEERIANDRNVPRFCVENRQITWVLMAGVILWGVFGYYQMPKRKDPKFGATRAAVVCPWPGVPADKVEQLVTKKIEAKIAGNVKILNIQSVSRSNLSVVQIALEESTVSDVNKQYDDIALRLNTINDLPDGAGPVTFLRDFGETAALMLTVSSPKSEASEIAWRSDRIREALDAERAKAPAGRRSAGIISFPLSVSPMIPRQDRDLFIQYAKDNNRGRDMVPIEGAGFVGVDGDFGPDDVATSEFANKFLRERLRPSEIHPDLWPIALVSDLSQTDKVLTATAGDKYSLKELDDYSELIQRTLEAVPEVSKVNRAGVLAERIYLEYSQARVASFGIHLGDLPQVLAQRNAIFPGGNLEVGGRNMLIDPSGEFHSEKEIGNILLGATPRGAPVYLRDVVDTSRGYEPPLYLNYYGERDASGNWDRDHSITLSVFMREDRQIADFGRQVDATLAGLRGQIPDDLILARTSDQPLQVHEIVGLFMRTLAEAIVLVVLLALVGFWEWRSAALMAISIPLTLAMTFGMMDVLGVDIQQVSIASLIIALGLLVDDPVVAIDAIKRELDTGKSPLISAWLGPTKLATAIMFATITNIVAYLPMLLITGLTGNFMKSLPVVLACALVASRIVSMTFVPLLGYYLLTPSKKPAPPIAERRQKGFANLYSRFAGYLIEHRKVALACSMLLLAAGAYYVSDLRLVFFPKDLSYLSFVDVWLPEDANIADTGLTAQSAEDVILKTAADFGKQHPEKDGKPKDVIKSLTTFIGGGGPRFWFSVAPELFQPNYAQIIIRVNDKRDTDELVAPLQRALSASVPGARIDVRQLETSVPIGVPVQIRISGENEQLLRQYGEQVEDIFRSIPAAARVRNDWGSETFAVKLKVDPERANLAGITNRDISISSAASLSGMPVSNLREGSKEIPIVSRLKIDDRARLSDVENLYAYSVNGTQKVPLSEVSNITMQMDTEKIARFNQFRTITVLCFPIPGALPSEVMTAARPALTKFAASLPPGYHMAIGGEEEVRLQGFGQIVVVLIVSTVMIFLALVFQFRSAVKPMIVFAAIPFGMVGALIALNVMNTAFGFIAFLGIVSLIGVIVSHVIVLFDFIEEAHAEGETLKNALIDAGILRLRPVLITVGATVIALFPLAEHGGPLWEPLCYAQIGGLLVATVVTLLLVPVLYATFVLDLKMVRWQSVPHDDHGQSRTEFDPHLTSGHPPTGLA